MNNDKTSFQIVKITVCKEDLQKWIDNTTWSEPIGRGRRHYAHVDGVIAASTDESGNNCVFHQSQTKDDRAANKPKNILFFGKTLGLWRDYMAQRKKYKQQTGK